MHTTHTIGSLLVCLFTGALLFAGCARGDTDTEGDEISGGAVESEDIAEAQEAIVSGWTAYTSEEYPPVNCDGTSLVSQARCSGKYCDNIGLYCTPTGGTAGGATWTSYFSEEGTNYRYCGAGSWVTGVACTGKYCDNISLQCRSVTGTPVNCYWTGWMSEENGGTLSFGAGYYARGVQCSGSYCDNKRYYACQKI